MQDVSLLQWYPSLVRPVRMKIPRLNATLVLLYRVFVHGLHANHLDPDSLQQATSCNCLEAQPAWRSMLLKVLSLAKL